jgi:hypothetical protein
VGSCNGGAVMRSFLRWWVLVAGTVTGLGFLVVYDCINYINEADVTKLSFVIFALFIHSTIQVGRSTYYKIDKIDLPRFMVGVMTKLGMLGTVIGFILMLSTCLGNISFQNVQSMQSVIGSMTSGMSTALVTTATGLVCSLVLQLQIFNFDQGGQSG